MHSRHKMMTDSDGRVGVIEDGGKDTDNCWERRLSERGKINFPPEIRSDTFYIVAPGAFPDMGNDEIRLYPTTDPPVVGGDGVVDGEIYEGKMTSSGQITIPAKFRRQSTLPPVPCDVTVTAGNNIIYIQESKKETING